MTSVKNVVLIGFFMLLRRIKGGMQQIFSRGQGNIC